MEHIGCTRCITLYSRYTRYKVIINKSPKAQAWVLTTVSEFRARLRVWHDAERAPLWYAAKL
eukprot:9498160-Pyramimonas_sp.AAC.2